MDEQQFEVRQLQRQVAELHKLLVTILTMPIFFPDDRRETLQERHPTYKGRAWSEIMDDILRPSGGMVDTKHSKCFASRRPGSSPGKGTITQDDIDRWHESPFTCTAEETDRCDHCGYLVMNPCKAAEHRKNCELW